MKAAVRGVFVIGAAMVLASALATRAGAQSATTGAIIGTVTDPSGAAVPDAAVVVLDTDTGIAHDETTNGDGFYSVTYLQPGTYTVSVTKGGFAVFTDKGILVQVGSRLTVDAALPLVASQASITVTGQTPLIETQKTAISQTVGQNLVNGLPINGRRWEDFVLLTPAVTTDGTSGLSSFRGISGLYNNNTVDGANNNQAFFSESRGRAQIVAYVYSADSMQEFQVNNSDYSAQYGQAAGGVVNAVTKSGTNQLHGDLFYALRYPSLNALDPVATAGLEANGLGATQTVHQQQQFGGSVGTPIIKNKLFFFGTFDGFRKVNPIEYFTTFGTPVTSLNCPTQVTTTQCNAAKSFIDTELFGAFPRDLKQNIGFGKLDYQLTPANHLSAVVNIQDWGEPDGYNTSATSPNAGNAVNGYGATHERFVIGNWTSTFGGNKVNDLRFQWGQDYEYDTTNSGGPFVAMSGLTDYGETNALPRPAFPDEHRYEMSDDFTIQKGEHSIKLGVDVNLIHELLVNLYEGNGNYQYTSTDAPLPAAVVTACNAGLPSTALTVEQEFCAWSADVFGANLGDGLTGQHYATFTQVDDPITHVGEDDFYNNDFGAYVEDTWKVHSNLTLNLGLRYDLQHVPQPSHPNDTANDPNATPLQTLYTSTINIDKGEIAPRIGIAWQFSKNTVLRMGYGIFFAKTSNSTYYALRVENGVYQQNFGGCTPTSSSATLKGCAPVFPDVYFVPPGPPLAPAFSGALTPVAVCTSTTTTTSCPTLPDLSLPTSSQAIHGMDPNFVNPRADEGEITLEHQLPGNIAVSASYLVTRGLHLPTAYDANVAPSTGTVSYDVLAGNTAGSSTVLTTTVPLYTTRLNPATGVVYVEYSAVSSWYNGLVLTIRKPFGHSVELLANYTYSKTLDDGEVAGGPSPDNGSGGTFYGTDEVSDPYNLNADYSYSDLDQRHRFVGSVVWTPDYYHGSSMFARQVANGWTLSTIVTAVTGQPYTDEIGGSTFAGTGGIDGGMTGGVVGANPSAEAGRALWLPRNSANMPTFANIDLRVERDFEFHERYKLAVRADAFNLFNSQIVQDVSTEAFTYTAKSATSTTCGTATHPGVAGCFLPYTSTPFGAPTTTSGALYGARQLQLGFQFEF